MTIKNYDERLPIRGFEREILREKGQFWTPDWVAQAMVSYIVAEGQNQVFDPAVGAGAFFRAAKTIANETGREFVLLGTELDALVLQQAQHSGLEAEDFANVQITDFVLCPPQGPFKGIIANPPYIRHHRLSSEVKFDLKRFSFKFTNIAIDGRAGIHIYFLLRALQLLAKNGRLAFIMPSDTCEGVFATDLWRWITTNYCLEAVITFTAKASPFPGVDTNPLIFMIKNAPPKQHFLWAKCTEANISHLKAWVYSEFKGTPKNSLVVKHREV